MQQITDHSGKLIALLESNSQQEKIYSPIGGFLGYYNRMLDKSYTSSGKYIGPGNQLMTLI